MFESALPSRLCHDLIDYGEEKASGVAVTGDFEDKELTQKIYQNYIKLEILHCLM